MHYKNHDYPLSILVLITTRAMSLQILASTKLPQHLSSTNLYPISRYHSSLQFSQTTKLQFNTLPYKQNPLKTKWNCRNTSVERTSKSTVGEKWEEILSTATSLYPLYLVIGGVIACTNPSAFTWFVQRGPASYSLSLGFIMLAMGLTLRLEDLVDVFLNRSFAVLFGCFAQYSIMPLSAALISKVLGLSPELSVGLILLGCCPGGTASNVVTLIAKGDVALSVVMTTCTTLAAVFMTPLLTMSLAGTLVPINAGSLALSTLKVVVAPVLVGSFLQSVYPKVVDVVVPFAPLLAVLTSSLLACSVFSANISLLKSAVVSVSGNFDILKMLSGQLGTILLSVILLHAAGYIVGYIVSILAGLKEPQSRAISIEVGMQNSSLGVVLASTNFSSPLIAVPAAVSAVVMNIMGSCLGFAWKHIAIPNEGQK